MERVGRLMRRTMPSERFPAANSRRASAMRSTDVAGHGQELFALRRKADGKGRPVEQDHAEPLLQCPDAAAEGGLGDVALLRRM